MSMQSTLGNPQWLRENEANIKELLPDTWTHVRNLNGLQIGFSLKLLGVDWHSRDEFTRIMVYLEKIGIMLLYGYTVKRNPRSIFREESST